jgi:hypothetical protein
MQIRVMPLLFSIFLCWGMGASKVMAAPSISLTITTDQNISKTGSHIKIQIFVKNISHK